VIEFLESDLALAFETSIFEMLSRLGGSKVQNPHAG
jgi:hypothetical protein